jgi:hypothetical protein
MTIMSYRIASSPPWTAFFGVQAASIRLAWCCNKRASDRADKDTLQRRIDQAARDALLDQLALSQQGDVDATEEGNAARGTRQAQQEGGRNPERA